MGTDYTNVYGVRWGSISFDLTRFGVKKVFRIPNEKDLLARLDNMFDTGVRQRYFPRGVKESIVTGIVSWPMVSSYLLINPCLRSCIGLLPVSVLRMWQIMFNSWLAEYTLMDVLADLELNKVKWLMFEPGQAIVSLYEDAKAKAIEESNNVFEDIQQAYIQNISEEDREHIEDITANLAFENVMSNCAEFKTILNDVSRFFQGTLADIESIIYEFNKIRALYYYLQIVVFYIDAKKAQITAWINEVEEAIQDILSGAI